MSRPTKNKEYEMEYVKENDVPPPRPSKGVAFLRIVDAEEDISKKGNEMIVLYCETIGGDCEGFNIRYYITNKKDAPWMAANAIGSLMRAIHGSNWKPEKKNYGPRDFAGHEVYAMLGRDAEDYPKIRYWIPEDQIKETENPPF